VDEVSELSVVDSPKSAEYVGGMSVLIEDDLVELEDDVVDWLSSLIVNELADMVDVDVKLVELEGDTEVVESPVTDEGENDWVLPEPEDKVELEVVPTLDVVVIMLGGVIEDEDWELDDVDDEDTEVELEVEGELIVLDDVVVDDTEVELEVEGELIVLDDVDVEDTEVELEEVELELSVLDDSDVEDTEVELGEVEVELSVLDDSDGEDNEVELEVVVIKSGGSDIDE
jgi:hypothetical protein